MIFAKIPLGILSSNTYILADKDSKQGVIVDIGGDFAKLQEHITAMDVKIEKILLTHGHLDHILDASKTKKYYAAPIYLHELDKDLYKDSKIRSFYGKDAPNDLPVDVFMQDGDIINFGHHQIKVIHTPGHTQGSVCFLVDNSFLLSGDTLFRNTIGRTDHEGGNTEQEIESIKTKLMVLLNEVEVFPGHGGNSTIGQERINNPYLKY